MYLVVYFVLTRRKIFNMGFACLFLDSSEGVYPLARFSFKTYGGFSVDFFGHSFVVSTCPWYLCYFVLCLNVEIGNDVGARDLATFRKR